ncbi:MAG TPA: Npt1/Npt2 family nucleotide transporter [Bryobacteraceae bacterium]|nr:Npt1/Npt2 family nucleotide transporter [Bryobacteraceae bacterium]
MTKIRAFWRSMFDVRPGEGRRTAFMSLYLMLVLFAYYILKPVSRSMFLNKFDIDKLPYLYILIAAVGGVLAYGYTHIAVKWSLKSAVAVATMFSIGCLFAIWYLLALNLAWMLYVFNIFVSLFSIMLVSQGWLVAANVFTTREAKRLYGILGVGSVFGAAFGGSFTALTVKYLGTRNLLLASAAMVAFSYLAFLAAVAQKGVSLAGVKGAEEEEGFSFKDIAVSIGKYRHLQVIIAIISMTYIVDVMVEYQFSAMAKEAYKGDQLTAFLGSFYGLWLNLVTFVLQFFLTAFVVSRFGVGGTLQIMPVSIGLASIATFLAPGVYSTGAARLAEAATRYSFNRTGMELLYLPLPRELKNKTKAFVDVFVDRLSRGMGGIILVLLTVTFDMDVNRISLIVIALSVAWILLSIRAKNEYTTTVRKRIEARRLDFEEVRINVNDAVTIRLLEQTLDSPVPRQAAYALSLLGQVPTYAIEKRLDKISESSGPELRVAAYKVAQERGYAALLDRALGEIRSLRAGELSPVIQPAVAYALAVSPEPRELTSRLIDHQNGLVAQSAIEALASNPQRADQLITKEWISSSVVSQSAGRRVLAAAALRLPGDADPLLLQTLLTDPSPEVAMSASRTAGVLQNRIYLDGLLRHLGSSRLRGMAIESIAAYGERIVGTLGDVLLDETMPVAVRRQIPRVLQRIVHQRSVDVLLQALSLEDLTIRSGILRSLNSLRQKNPDLTYGRDSVLRHIHKEARYYFELNAALEPFREQRSTPCARLLANTIKERLSSTLERMFRLVGLRYPPKDIYAAYRALNHRTSEEYTAALEFLDNVLERELKRVVLPLLDDEVRMSQSGLELFGIELKDARTAIRDLIRSGDSWLVACAIATAVELKFNDLIGEIAPLSERAGTEVSEVAKSAIAALTGPVENVR